MLNQIETSNRIIEVVLEMQELWKYVPSNPEHIDPEVRFNQLVNEKQALEEYYKTFEQSNQ